MLSGPPLPLPPGIPLHCLRVHTRSSGVLGAWVRGSARTLHLYETSAGAPHRILIGPDLGHLLGRCSRIALRQGTDLVVLDADDIIRWRVLQVVTATPHLPSSERLNEVFPEARLGGSGFQVGLQSRPPEHVLAECLTHGIPVTESRIVYARLPTPPVDSPPPPPQR
jgi:hypothetical protein